ncbi:MAG TPA: dihydroorotase [Dehalococcoidia bacterium]|nr:dihydroorotase [Dehalococcoidia bacterium]
MKPVLIKGGRIIDPDLNTDCLGNLFITGGVISELTDTDSVTPNGSYEVINAEGMIVCPGFVDFHCHLRQPGFEEKETIASGSRAAAKGGFTTICCMPNTNPPLDSKETIDYVKSIAASEGHIRVLPISCITRGRKGEELADMEELAESNVIAFSDDGDTVMDSDLMRRAMERSLALGLPISDHCEDKSISRGIKTREGATAAEENIVGRDILLAQQTGAHIHIAHISTRGSVELIRRAKEQGINITTEATPHHLTLTQDIVPEYGTMAKVNPPLRTQSDVAALIGGLNDGTIDIIATDHAPHTDKDKQKEFAAAAPGISGFETALASLMGLVHSGQIELKTLIAKLTSEPAKIISDRFGRLGTIEVGVSADVTVFDPDLEWTVNTEYFFSKGKNTPLNGKKLKGKVIATIYNGIIVYRDDSLLVGEVKTGSLRGCAPQKRR